MTKAQFPFLFADDVADAPNPSWDRLAPRRAKYLNLKGDKVGDKSENKSDGNNADGNNADGNPDSGGNPDEAPLVLDDIIGFLERDVADTFEDLNKEELDCVGKQMLEREEEIYGMKSV
jgi:hypothetical protein